MRDEGWIGAVLGRGDDERFHHCFDVPGVALDDSEVFVQD